MSQYLKYHLPYLKVINVSFVVDLDLVVVNNQRIAHEQMSNMFRHNFVDIYITIIALVRYFRIVFNFRVPASSSVL